MFDTQLRSARFVVAAAGAVVYLLFCWGLVSHQYVLLSYNTYVGFAACWSLGLLVLSWFFWRRPPADMNNTQRLVFARLLWFNVGSVLVAVLVPGSLRFLMLVVPLFGVMYAGLRMHHERVWCIALATWLAYALSASLLAYSGSVAVEFEALASVAFTFLLGGTVYFANDLAFVRKDARRRHKTLEQSVAELSMAAMRDELTGLFNRRYIVETLKRQKALADRDQLEFTVAYCDLDHFKQVNDEHGHSEGDRALVQFAELARGHVRSMDYVARLGGEEFLLILVGANELIARRVCERMCGATREMRVGSSGEPGLVTVSCGVARYRLGESVTDLLARADSALYEAKRRGRDQVVTAGG